MSEVTQRFTDLLQKAQKTAESNGQQWWAYAEPEQQSPCQYGEIVDQQVAWWPVMQTEPLDFSGLEHALELQLHPDIKSFYSTAFGGGLRLQHQRGLMELLMPWHQADTERLQQNIIGHVLMKRRLKQQITIFFAVTDDEDLMLSLHNNSGEVYLERVGSEVSEKLAGSLAEFLQLLTLPA